MRKENSVYVTVINVPKEMTKADVTSIFVEIRAEFIMFSEDGVPMSIIQVNNLSLIDAATVKWIEFSLVVENLVKEYFLTFKTKKQKV